MSLFQKIKKAFKVEPKPSSFLAQILSSASATSRKGAAETLKSYKESPWFRAACARVSKSISAVTWELYAVKKQGKAVKVSKLLHAPHEEKRKIYQPLKREIELVEIEDHPLLDLINRCNSVMTGSYVRQLTQIYLDSVGEAFWIKERNKLNVPIELWPIPPTWVTDLPSTNNPYFIVQMNNIRVPIPPTEMIWFKEPDPENPYLRGSGLGMTLGDELDTDEFSAQHTKAWFYNRARPDLLVYGDGLQPADTQRMEQEWLKRNQGFWKAFKPFFISRKIEVKELSQSFSDMDLIPLRKYERDIIIQTFGVTPEILGIIENSNRATIEAASYIFALYCLVPRLETLREYLQMFLVPDFDDRIIIDYVSPVAEDKEYQLRAATAASWALTKDEWRKMAGKEPLPEDQGKVFMVPAMLMEVPMGKKKEEPAVEEGKTKAIKASRPLLTEDQEIKRWNAKVKGWDNWEGKWKRELKKYFQQQQDEVLAKLRDQKAVQKFSIEEVLFERAKYNKLLTDLAMPLLISILEDGAEEAAELIGFDYSLFDVTNPHVQEWVGSRLELIKDINDTTRDLLKETLREGIGKGETISQLSERATQVFSQAKGNRAEVISRTETIAAYVQGNVELYREAGIKELEFFTAMDERVCEECYSKHGNTYKVEDSIGVIPVHPQCYDKKTEVYTDNGWKLFSELQTDDKIYSLNPDILEAEFLPYKQKVSYQYNGKMIHYTSRNFDLMVTPDHSQFIGIKGKSGIHWKLTQEKDLPQKHYIFYRGLIWHGKSLDYIQIGNHKIKTEIFCKFLAYYLSDGNVSKLAKGDNKWQISISKSKEKNPKDYDLIQSDLLQMPVTWWCGKDKFFTTDDDLCEYVKQFGKANEKFIPQIIKDLSKDQIKAFLDAYVLCDGYVKKGKTWKGGTFSDECSYFTSSKRMADDLGELILKVGHRPSFNLMETKGEEQIFSNGTYTINHDVWRITECPRVRAWEFEKKEMDYNDFVYDVELPKWHVLLVRRNGKIVWSGNCRCDWIPVIE